MDRAGGRHAAIVVDVALSNAAVAEVELVANRGLDERLPLPQLVAVERVLEQLRGEGVVCQHQGSGQTCNPRG